MTTAPASSTPSTAPHEASGKHPAPAPVVRGVEELLGPATVATAAEYYGLHHTTIRRWIRNGELNGYRVGTRMVRVDMAEVAAMMAKITPDEVA